MYVDDFPGAGSVFDFIADSHGEFIRAENTHAHPTTMTLAPLAPEMPIYIPSSHAITCTYIMQALVARSVGILVTGERGSGKSLMLQQFCYRRKYEELQARQPIANQSSPHS